MNFNKDNPNIYWKRVTIPKGLPGILESLAKESMRENPDELVPFLSKVVDDLIAKRDQEELLEKGASGSGANPESGVSLTKASKVESTKRKLEEENPLLGKETTKPQYTTEVDEELAASKIQAGFRGYQTRKLLKESKGGGLPLTSLTALQQEALEEVLKAGDDKKDTNDKASISVDDEAIAAELKAPLETIREESVDGSLRIKTPEVLEAVETQKSEVDTNLTNQPILEDEGESSAAINDAETDQVQQEQTEEKDLAEEHSDEIQQKDSDEPIVAEETSDTLVVSKELSYEEQTIDSLGSLNRSSDKDEQLSEAEVIGETDIETLVEGTETKKDLIPDEARSAENLLDESETVDNENTREEVVVAAIAPEEPQRVAETPEIIVDEVVDEECPEEEYQSEEAIIIQAVEEDAIVIEAAAEETAQGDKAEELPDVEIKTPPSTPANPNTEVSDAEAASPAGEEKIQTPETPNPEIVENEEVKAVIDEAVENTTLESPTVEDDAEQQIVANVEESPKEIPSSPVSEPLIPSTPTPTEPGNETSETPKEDETNYIPEEVSDKTEESTVKVPENSQDNLSEINVPEPDDQSPLIQKEESMQSTDSDKPDLSVTIPVSNLLTETESFTNTDSVSSSTTTTVRALASDKNVDSSQDASSIPESETPPPVPKPRSPKPSSPLPEMESPKRQRMEPQDAAEGLEEPAEGVSELPAAPVMRRQRSSQKKSRASASMYRSGLVMDDEVSMEEMEAQIENEMLSQAATKIQAGFRGYKTRKSFRQSGVSNAAVEDTPVAAAEACPPEPLCFPAATEATNITSEPADITAETNISQQLPVSDASVAFSDETSFLSRRSHEGSCPPETTSSSNSKPSLGFLRSRSYPGSAEGDALIEADEHHDEPLPNVEYDPDYINNAATVIQATVRGYLVRKRSGLNKRNKREIVHRNDSGEFEDLANPNEPEFQGLLINPADRDSLSPVSDVDSDKAATKIQAAFRGYKDRQKVRKTKKAVVTIQATVRGFLARRRLAKSMRRRSMQRRRSSAKLMSQEIQKMQKVNDAATKIQAVYRGYQVRSKIRKHPNDE